MKVYYINEFDNDYKSWTGTEKIIFSSKEKALEYCKEQSCSGYTYTLDSKFESRDLRKNEEHLKCGDRVN